MDRSEPLGPLVDEILATRWRESPVIGTFEGVHGADGRLDSFDPEHLAAARRTTAAFLARLGAIPETELTLDERLDLQLLKDHLGWDLVEHDEVRSWRRHATLYPDLALYGVYLLALRDSAPIEERLLSIRSRLAEVPRLLAEGKANLTEPVRIATEMAVHVAEGGKDLFAHLVPALADAVPRLKPELEAHCLRAVEAMEDYRRFLAERLLPRSVERFALGADLFDEKLRTYHHLPYTGEDLVEIARAERDVLEGEIQRLAGEIEPGADWRAVVERLKGDHPPAEGLLDAYRRSMEEARSFLVERGIVELPGGESVEIVETPLFDRPRTPYAAMIPPGAFEGAHSQKTLFFVTPVDDSMPPAEREERLRGHCLWAIPITAVHEAYPGHHLQFVHAHRLSSRARRVYGTEVLIEGWALYCEEVMYEEGFYRDPRARLFQWKDLLWRVYRVFVDVGLHNGTMGREEAVRLLVEGADLERPNAESEVNRYCLSPTQPLSYLIGRRLILDLREALRRREGKAFSLASFHNRLLSYGSISPLLIREAMLGSPG